MEPSKVLGLLALALVFGGCTAAPQPAPLQDPQATTAAEAAGSAVAAAEETATGVAAPEPVVTPFSYQGTTDTAGCVFVAVAGQCHGADGANSFYELPDVDGAPRNLVATFTWTPATPATGMLRAFLLQLEGDAWTWEDGDPMAEGSSPLTLDVDLAALEAEGFALSVNAFQGAGAGVAFAGATLPQDFTVEGSVTSLPEA